MMTSTIDRTRPDVGGTKAGWSGAERLGQRLASWRVLTVSGLFFIAFAAVFFASSAPFAIPHVEDVCGAAPLDVRLYSTGGDVNRFLNECGESGRAAYLNMQIADLFYPAVFGVFMAAALGLTLKHLFPLHQAVVGLAVVPLVGSGFDYLENALAWRALAAYPDAVASNSLLGLASTAKTVTFWIAGAMLLAGLAALLVRAIRRLV